MSKWDDDCVGVVAVDYAGQPPDMKGISSFVRSNGGFVVEDCCHGVGTSFCLEDQKLVADHIHGQTSAYFHFILLRQ